MNFECVGYRDKLCMIIDIIDDDDYERGKQERRASVLKKFTMKLHIS